MWFALNFLLICPKNTHIFKTTMQICVLCHSFQMFWCLLYPLSQYPNSNHQYKDNYKLIPHDFIITVIGGSIRMISLLHSKKGYTVIFYLILNMMSFYKQIYIFKKLLHPSILNFIRGWRESKTYRESFCSNCYLLFGRYIFKKGIREIIPYKVRQLP